MNLAIDGGELGVVEILFWNGIVVALLRNCGFRPAPGTLDVQERPLGCGWGARWTNRGASIQPGGPLRLGPSPGDNVKTLRFHPGDGCKFLNSMDISMYHCALCSHGPIERNNFETDIADVATHGGNFPEVSCDDFKSVPCQRLTA